MSVQTVKRAPTEEAKHLLEQARNIIEEYADKEMPADKENQVNQLFDQVEAIKRRIDLEAKASGYQSWLKEPQRKTGFPTKEEMSNEEKMLAKKAFGEYLRKGRADLEPEGRKILSSISDPEGGVLVPEEFRAELIAKRRDMVQIRQRATVLTTTSGSIGFPTFDYDGDAEWTAENTQIGEEDITNAFGKQSFTPHKLARIFRVPMELTEDAAVNVEGLLTDHFAERFGEIEENAFINGDGSEKPLGLLAAGLNTRDATGSGTAPIEPEDIFDMIYDIRAVNRAQGAFMFHRNGIREIRKMRDSANGQFLWQPGLQAGEPSTLAGYPVLESEFFPDNVASGSAGDPLGIFGDFRAYWIVDRVDFSIQRLVEKYAEFDQVGFKMRERTDGAPVRRDAFVVLVRG